MLLEVWEILFFLRRVSFSVWRLKFYSFSLDILKPRVIQVIYVSRNHVNIYAKLFTGIFTENLLAHKSFMKSKKGKLFNASMNNQYVYFEMMKMRLFDITKGYISYKLYVWYISCLMSLKWCIIFLNSIRLLEDSIIEFNSYV